ncbi:MAG TPA: hypothetical protein PLP33_25315 [Leptospiraceae bacterium]|nr:hypothetical protein [Leptospiraceae bacterium]
MHSSYWNKCFVRSKKNEILNEKSFWELEKDGLIIYAVLYTTLKTFRWSLFKDGNMVDCGDLSGAAQMNLPVFVEKFAEAILTSFRGVVVEFEEIM